MIWMLFTILGGLMFLGCQALEWTHLHGEGFWWGHIPTCGENVQEFFNTPGCRIRTTGDVIAPVCKPFSFTITGFHGFHVFFGGYHKYYNYP